MKTVAVIPTYNERENIGDLIEGILSFDQDCDILVVDDRSPDQTADRVRDIMRASKRVF